MRNAEIVECGFCDNIPKNNLSMNSATDWGGDCGIGIEEGLWKRWIRKLSLDVWEDVQNKLFTLNRAVN